jgi:hypothetical protein
MIFARLNKAVFEGFGTYSDFNTSTEEEALWPDLKRILLFFGAKTFQQVNDMSNFYIRMVKRFLLVNFKSIRK